MNTQRSDALVKAYREQPLRAVRRVVEFGGDLPAAPEQVFALLCPTREADWIPGWSCELIHTESGYAEEGCIFRTGEDCVAGPGLWVIHTHEPPRLFALTRVLQSVVVELRIQLTDNGDGTTASAWTVSYTGLDEPGNAEVDELVEHRRGDEIVGLMAHYLETGEMASSLKGRLHHE